MNIDVLSGEALEFILKEYVLTVLKDNISKNLKGGTNVLLFQAYGRNI